MANTELKIKMLKDSKDTNFLPFSTSKAVFIDGTDKTVDTKLTEIEAAIPTKTSDLTNDSNFAVDANYVHTDNNYTTTEKTKLSGIEAGAEVNIIEAVKVNGTALTPDQDRAVDITVAGSADNISYDNTISGLTADDVQEAIDELANEKVDKVSGKGLSTNDYTTDEKNKLAGIEARADVNTIESISVNSTTVSPVNKNVNITVPTTLAALTGDTTHRTVSDTDIDNWDAKQDELVSGVNIRTVNGNNLLGSGDIAISTTLPDSLINWGTSVGTSPIFNDLVQRYIYVVKFTYSTNTTAYLRYRKPDESITSITIHSVAPEIMDANGPILLITTSDTTCELHYVSDNKYYVCTVTYNSSTGLLTANNEVFHIPHLAYISSAMGAPNAPVAITSDMINRIKGKNKAYYINIGQNKNGNKALRLYLSINGGSTINITNTSYYVVGDIKIYAVDLDDYGIAVGVIVHVPTHLGMYVFKINTSDNSVTDLIKPNGDVSQYTGYSASATQVLSHDSSGNKIWTEGGGGGTLADGVPVDGVIGWDTDLIAYELDGTETGDYYLTYNNVSYYFTMPSGVANGEQLFFNTSNNTLTYSGNVVTTFASGSGTQLIFVDYIPDGYEVVTTQIAGYNASATQFISHDANGDLKWDQYTNGNGVSY